MATLFEKLGWLITDRERRHSAIEWYGAKAMLREPKLAIPFSGHLTSFTRYKQYWGCRSQIPDEGPCALLERTIRPGSVVFDIGAYMGIFSIMIGKLAGDAAIYSFEPAPATFEQLVYNVKDNNLGNITPFNIALCDREGRIGFSADRGMKNKIEPAPPGADPDLVEVESTTIDAFCREHGIPECDFMKIDVEGAEPRVLRGAGEMLGARRIKCILIEVCPDNLSTLGSSPEELFSVAASYGYSFFSLSDDGTPGRRLSALDLAQISIDNVLLK